MNPATINYGKDSAGNPVYESASSKGTVNSAQAVAAQTIAPTPAVPTTIGSATLKNGTSPYQLPPLVNTTAPATALGTTAGIASGGAEADSKAAETAAANPTSTAPVNTDRTAVLGKIMDNLNLESTKGDFTTATQNDAGLADKTNALNDINKNITLTTQSYDNQIKELKKNNAGAFNGGNDQEVNELTVKKNEDLANLAIIKSTALGDVDTANAIIKQKVDAKFTPIEDNIKNLENYAQLMQNDLSDSEKLTIQTKIDEQKTAKGDVSSAYAEASKTAAANGAPASVQAAIDAAAKQATQDIIDGKTPSTGAIYGALGSYGQNQTDIAYKQAQLEGIRLDNQKKIDDAKGGGSSNVQITDDKGNAITVPTDIAPYVNTSNSGVNYMDASTLQGTAAEKTKLINLATQSGLKVITNKNEAADLTNIQDANSKLDSIGTIFAGLAQPNALARNLYGLGLSKLAVLTESDPQKAAAGALQSVGLDMLKAISGVQGFRGNQTAIEQVNKHLPTIYDTQDVVTQKIAYVRQLISDRENAIVGKPSEKSSSNSSKTSDPLGLFN